MKIIVFLIIILIFLVLLNIIDMQRISIRRYSLKGKDRLKIIQFSDLHKRSFGSNNCKLLDIVKKENPDILVFTGDLISRNQEDFSQLETLIQNSCMYTKVYFILGNHELDMPKSNCKALCNKLQSHGAILLDNQHIQIADSTYLWGATIPLKCYHNGNHGYGNLYFYLQSDLQSTLQVPSKDNFNILLAHNPFFFESYSKWGADLTLSGHVHGGIIRLPFINGLLSPERKFLPKYSGGLYNFNSNKMIVSRGLGKLRFFNPPEVSVIEIEN